MFIRKRHATAAALGALAAGALILPGSAAAGGNSALTVNDDATGPGPAGANCAAAGSLTIQAAVDAAAPGDTILVCAGNYPEDVTVNKAGLNLLGAQAGNDAGDRTVTAANEATLDGSFSVTADDVSINGFTVENADAPATGGSGIVLSDGTGDHSVTNNVVRNNTIGLSLSNDGGQTVIRQNLFADNNVPGAAAGNGIYGDTGSENVRIDENEFTGNDNAAVTLTETTGRNSDIDITDNELTQNRGIAVFLTDDLTVTGNTINDTDSGDGNGRFSAIYLGGGVDDALVQDNTVMLASTGVRIDNQVPEPNTDVEVLGNTLTDNDNGIRISNGATSGTLEVHGNRLVDNTTAAINNEDPGDSVDAENNWFGCNEGPGSAGCDDIIGAVDAEPNLILRLKAPPRINADGTRRITAKIRSESGGTPCLFPDDTTITFATTSGEVNPTSAPTRACRATTRLTVPDSGQVTVSATLDNETVTDTVKVKEKN